MGCSAMLLSSCEQASRSIVEWAGKASKSSGGGSAGGGIPIVELTIALTWTAAGLILLIFGWLTLSKEKESPRKPGAARSSGSSPLRVLGGALAGGVAAFSGAALLAYLATAGRIPTWTGLVSGWTRFVQIVAGAAGAAARLLRPGASALVRYLGMAGSWLMARLAWLGRGTANAAGTYGPMAYREIVLAVRHGLPVAHVGLTDALAVPLNEAALIGAVIVGGVAGWMSANSRWSKSGVTTFMGLGLLSVGLVALSYLIARAASGPLAQLLATALLVIEVFGLLLFLSYQFYVVEYLAGRDAAEAEVAPVAPGPDGRLPRVAVQIAAYNEPIPVVLRCLASVVALDYPKDRLVIQLADDSTDPHTVTALRQYAEEHGVVLLHRSNRRGFKGGALNDALRALPAGTDYIAIVDSDYVVDPKFLRLALGPFRDSAVAFVQTPQAYRNAVPGSFARMYALADAYFYRVVLPVRARVQSPIFCGTMGIVRRAALDRVGGWSETCVTEDAELSLRLLGAGWKGAYIDRTLGWGLAPTTLATVRSQHRRWAFGGLQMLRLNRASLDSPKLTFRQRIDFRMGGLFWVDGLFLLGAATILSLLVAVSWIGVTLPIGSAATLAVVASAPLILTLDAVMKIRGALRPSEPVTNRDVLGVLAFWYAIKLNDLWAALRGAVGAPMGFVRTPKETERRPTRRRAFREALAGSWLETTISFLIASVVGFSVLRWYLPPHHVISLAGALLLAWLSYYSLAFAAAPVLSYSSRFSPPDREDGTIAPPARPSTPADDSAHGAGRPAA